MIEEKEEDRDGMLTGGRSAPIIIQHIKLFLSYYLD